MSVQNKPIFYEEVEEYVEGGSLTIERSAIFRRSISLSEDLVVEASCRFLDSVTCRKLIVTGKGTLASFEQDLKCQTIVSTGSINVRQKLTVESSVSYSGRHSDLIFGSFVLGAGAIESLPDESVLVAGLQEDPSVALIPQDSNSLCSVGHCEECFEETYLQTLNLGPGHSVSYCRSCLSDMAIAHLPVEVKRVPADWELASMSDEEKTFLAEAGFVTFPPRFPDSPFLQVSQESQDGELVHKQICLFDPANQCLTPAEVQNNSLTLYYNGGLVANLIWALMLVFALPLGFVVLPVLGPLLTTLLYFSSMPLLWKISKKANNSLNDAVFLPREMEKRRLLIEGRRKDKVTRNQTYVEPL